MSGSGLCHLCCGPIGVGKVASSDGDLYLPMRAGKVIQMVARTRWNLARGLKPTVDGVWEARPVCRPCWTLNKGSWGPLRASLPDVEAVKRAYRADRDGRVYQCDVCKEFSPVVVDALELTLWRRFHKCRDGKGVNPMLIDCTMTYRDTGS